MSEFYTLTEITATSASNITIISSANTAPTPSILSFPTTISQKEALEGMLIKIPTTMTITNNFNPFGAQSPRGELELASNGKQINFTESNIPSVAGLATYLAEQDALKIILDDDKTSANNFPVYHLAVNTTNKLRAGSTIANLTGIMDFGFDSYRIRPLAPVVFENSNPRTGPPVLTGNIKVATVNLLNFFNGDGQGGGFPKSRGATTLAAFNLQKTKAVKALKLLNADVIGFEELESDGYGAQSAIQELTNALNDTTAPGTYQIINHGSTLGTDVISVGIIYKPAIVTPFGISMSTSTLPSISRPPMAQTFTANNTCEKFTVVVNHFKSKGSAPVASDPNFDQYDGQGNWNLVRVQSATALNNWINSTIIPAAGSNDVLILGDLNAYKKEDPIKYLEDAQYTNLVSGTSYAFDGFFGSLDHLMSSASLTPQYVDGGKWQNNSDEVGQLFQYDGTMPEPTEYATSDHNPTIASFTKSIAANSIVAISSNKVKLVDNYLLDSDCKIIAKVIPGTASGVIDGNVTIGTTNIIDGTAKYCPRKYEITPATNGTALVTLYYIQSEFDTYNQETNYKDLPLNATDVSGNKANLRIFKKDGTTTIEIDPADSDIVFANGHWQVTFEVSGFSEFFLGTNLQNALPVTLKSFTAQKHQNSTLLNWKVSNETGFGTYQIQRSENGKLFEVIGNIIGTNNENYEYLDQQINHSLLAIGVYYRLKMIDLNGKFEYSKIIFLKNNENKSIVGDFYPNPIVSNKTTIGIFSAEQMNWTITAFDLTGKVISSEIKTLIKGQNYIEINLKNKKEGLILFRLENAEGVLYKKVLSQ